MTPIVLGVVALVVVGTLVAIGIGLFIYSLAPRTTAAPRRSDEAQARDDVASS